MAVKLVSRFMIVQRPLLRILGALLLLMLNISSFAASPIAFTNVFYLDSEVKSRDAQKIIDSLSHSVSLSHPFEFSDNIYLRIENNARRVLWDGAELSVFQESNRFIPEAEQDVSPSVMSLNLILLGQALFDAEMTKGPKGTSITEQTYFKYKRAQTTLAQARVGESILRSVYVGKPEEFADDEDFRLDWDLASAEHNLRLDEWFKIRRDYNAFYVYQFAEHVVSLYRKLFSELYAVSLMNNGDSLLSVAEIEGVPNGIKKGLVSLEKFYGTPNRFFIMTNSDLFFRQARAVIWQKLLRMRSLRDRMNVLHLVFEQMKLQISEILNRADFGFSQTDFKHIAYPNHYLLFNMKIDVAHFNERLSSVRIPTCSLSLL